MGKSTFFRACTLKDIAVANYPFTTIEANHGVAHVRAKCPHVESQTPCNPKHGSCINGTRYVPVDLVDVAGLVPGAHEGKGLGNRFLDDLRQAHALIHVVDASGATDAEGNPVGAGTHDPMADVQFLEDEVDHWIRAILEDGWQRMAKRVESAGGLTLERVLAEKLTGLGLNEARTILALKASGLDAEKPSAWGGAQLLELARSVRRQAKPILVALNKSDQVGAGAIAQLVKRLSSTPAVATSADAEMALRNAAKAGLIGYQAGASAFELNPEKPLNAKQQDALDVIRGRVLQEHGSTGVMQALEYAAYELLGQIVVYPVEDESKLTDKDGNVLPDALLVSRGITAKELAYRVHTDLGDHFIRAIDARTKRVIGADHELADGAVVRIVSNK